MILLLFLTTALSLGVLRIPIQTLPARIESYAPTVTAVEILVLTALAWALAKVLHQAGRKTSNSTLHISSYDSLALDLISAVLYGLLIATTHYIAWVPVELAAILALPCILLPPLIHRVYSKPQEPISPLFSLEETCRAQDTAFASHMIRQFLERYPQSKTYIYRNKENPPHSAGGLILHNREALATPVPTNLEVILDCPFSPKVGVIVEGKENFQAYLSRPKGTGTVISPLPLNTWEEWLMGMSKREWFDHIEEMKFMKVTHAGNGDIPPILDGKRIVWQDIHLT